MRVVIDTCMIVDALQAREPFYQDAQSIFLLCANQQFEGFFFFFSITDIYYLIFWRTRNDKGTRAVLSKLCALFGLLDTTELDIRKAIFSEISDFADAVMVETAMRSDMDGIVTRNTKDYKKASFSLYSPSDFVKLLTEETTSDYED